MSKYIIKLNSKFITTKWWSQKWCNNISQYADYSNRLERGRTYLRKGTVQDLVIESGKVTASVLGSSVTPYQVIINIKPLPDDKAKEALKNLHSINEFQYGRVSLDKKYLFSMDKNGLFPTIDEIEFSCTCPDWASLCKHGAAVLYAIGSVLDQEPLVLFQLRGIDVDAYLEQSLVEKTNTLLSNIYNNDDKIIDESLISDIFGIELASMPDSPVQSDVLDDTSKTSDVVRIIEIKPNTNTITEKPKTVVRQYNLDGVFIQQFDTCEEAARKTMVSKTSIGDACRGSQETAGGFQWRIVDAADEIVNIGKHIPLIDYSLLISKPIQQLNEEGKLIKEFSSAIEASCETGINISWIRDVLSGRKNQAGGFNWKLIDNITLFARTRQVSSDIQTQESKKVETENDDFESNKLLAQKESEQKLREEQEEIARKLREQQEAEKERKEKELLRKQEEAKKRQEAIERQKESYRAQGFCQHCGGSFKKKFLIFSSDICSRCGKKKDY